MHDDLVYSTTQCGRNALLHVLRKDATVEKKSKEGRGIGDKSTKSPWTTNRPGADDLGIKSPVAIVAVRQVRLGLISSGAWGLGRMIVPLEVPFQNT